MNAYPNMEQEHQRIRCLICDTTFWTYDSFRSHMKIHIEESTRYQCVYCCQCILSLDSLVAHLQEHTEGLITSGIVNYQHIISPQVLSFQPPPVQPKVVQKTNEKVFECALCNDKFKKRSYMSLHMKQVHQRVKGEKQYRPRKPDQWKRNVRSKLRNSGQEFVTRSGKVVASRKLKPPCESCRHKCKGRISENIRQKLFDKFWALGDLQAQRHYVHKLMDTVEHPDRRRKFVNRFRIVHNGVTHRVCHKFFLNTFGISSQFVNTINAKSNDGMLEGEKRGVGNKQRRLAILKPQIVDYINRIPRHQQSCKFGETHEYIDGGRTLIDSYKGFKTEQEAKGVKRGCYETFRNIFYNDFNISLIKSRKRRCDVCDRKKKTEDQISRSVTSHSVFGAAEPLQFPSVWASEITGGADVHQT